MTKTRNGIGRTRARLHAEARSFARHRWPLAGSAALFMICAGNTTCLFQSHSCTADACIDGVTITLRTANGAWTAGTYTVQLTVDGQPDTCTLSTADPPSNVQGTCSLGSSVLGPAFSFVQESRCVTMTQGNATSGGCAPIPGQFHQSLVPPGTPTQVGLIVSLDGHQLVSETLAIKYTAFEPSGPGCGVCHQASPEVIVPL